MFCLNYQGTSENDVKCLCPEGFYGEYCQHKKYLCEDIQCAHAGVCTDGKYGANCSCAEGFEGKYCENEIDECRSNPCANGKTTKATIFTKHKARVSINLTNLFTSETFTSFI
jgi:hypothetical protein